MRILIEAELLLDWYLPKLEIRISDAKRETHRALWRDALLPVMNEPQTWVLRDYHSPNLLWLPEREGTARVGLLDFQDAVMGPAAFDRRFAAAGRARRCAGENGNRAVVAIHARAPIGAMPRLMRPHSLVILDARRATCVENPGDFSAARSPGPQAAIFASSAARIELSSTLSCPSAPASLAAWYRANVPPVKV